MKGKSKEVMDKKFNSGRREFGKLALSGLLSGALLSQAGRLSAQEKSASKSRPAAARADIKLSTLTGFDKKEMVFLKQLGLDYVETFVAGDADKGENLVAIKKQFEESGMTLSGIYDGNYYHGENADTIRLGRPGRDKLIESFKVLMRDMKRAGIGHYHMMGWQPATLKHGDSYDFTGTTRGGARSLLFDYEKSQKVPVHYGREYSADEMWENFEYFIKRVMPAAEENDIKIGMHPNFAVPQVGGVAYIFNSFEGYKRAFEIADSDNFGILFCTGTWATGGGENGPYGDAVKAIRYFGKRNKIFHVHFRNIAARVPEPCLETFVDDGYLNMYEVMKALKEVGYRGTMMPDHYPLFIDKETRRGAQKAYAIAYMRGLLDALRNEG